MNEHYNYSKIWNYLLKLFEGPSLPLLGLGMEEGKLKIIKLSNILREFVGMCDKNIISQHWVTNAGYVFGINTTLRPCMLVP